jgi:hypothetical protein
MRSLAGRFSLLLLSLAFSTPGPLAAQPELDFAARLHLQYANSSVESAIDDAFARRARIELNWRVNEVFDGGVEADLIAGGVADAWGRITFAPQLAVSVGQFKRAFSTFDLSSSNDLHIIERDGRVEGVNSCPGVGSVCTFSRFTQRLQFDARDIGLSAEGAFGERVSYLITLTNGEGANAADVNDAKSVSGRLVVTPVEGLDLGVFAASHDYLDPDDETGRAMALGADLEWGAFRDGFHLMAGAATGDNWLLGEDGEFTTAQVMTSLYVPFAGGSRFAGIEPLLRVSWASTEDAEDEGGALLVTPGLSLYVFGRSSIALNLDRYDPDSGPSEWSLKVQMFAAY